MSTGRVLTNRIPTERILITRPEPECSVWTTALRLQGLPVVALPLIDIAPVPFTWDAAARWDAFVFVSRSAVDGFFKTQSLASLQAARCLVTGPGTRAALIQHGLAADRIDAPDPSSAQFDSEALWQVIGKRNWQGRRIGVVRGSNYMGETEGRSWLADQLQNAGAQLDFLTTYQRRLPVLTDASRDVLEKPMTDSKVDAVTSDVWVFSSSQAIAHLKLLVPSRDWSQSRAIATHERIFIAAKGAGFGKVAITRPVLADVVAALKTPKQPNHQLNWL
jgi:uroporphyrinogen-III synthase